MDQTLDEVKETGYATTILGRRREITGIRGDRGFECRKFDRGIGYRLSGFIFDSS